VNRDAFNAMMEAAEVGAIRRIVAVKLDRLARNVRDFLTLVDRLQSWGCDLVLIKESFDTSPPHGKFALTMFAAMAELEAATITERVMTGKAEKARQGGFNGSRAPYGYTYDGAVFTVNPEQAAIVRKVFDLFNRGATLSAIALHLNDLGAPTANGGRWYASTIRYLLSNGFYAGLAQWDGVETQAGEHSAIIERSEYTNAQGRLDALKPGPRAIVNTDR
jgi:site-specific DNA recombinase